MQVWTRIRPLLEPTALQSKRERLKQEMNTIQTARRTIIHTSYQEFKKRLMPSQWKYLPRTFDICALDPFAKVLDAEADVFITAADFEEAFRQLPELLSASSDVRQIEARSLLEIPTSVIQPPSSLPEPGEIPESGAALSSSHPDALNLATAAFTCEESPCNSLHVNKAPYLFGWDDIASHYCRLDSLAGEPFWYQQPMGAAPTPPKIAFSPLGSDIAGTVVRAAGLDDRVATVSDMDAKDLRFGCFTCPSQKRNGALTKVGYNWRDFVGSCLWALFFSPVT